MKLRDYPTLNHVVGFVRDRAPQQAAPAAEPTPAAVDPSPPHGRSPRRPQGPARAGREAPSERAAEPAPEPAAPQAAPIADADAEGFPRRIPIAVLRPALEHCVADGRRPGARRSRDPDAGCRRRCPRARQAPDGPRRRGPDASMGRRPSTPSSGRSPAGRHQVPCAASTGCLRSMTRDRLMPLTRRPGAPRSTSASGCSRRRSVRLRTTSVHTGRS